MITSLEPDEIFVFGSNAMGHHAGGAAAQAHKDFSAEWGVGEGITGQCYALPTMEGKESFRDAISRFYATVLTVPQKTFLVTPVGTGIAGYSIDEVRDMFSKYLWPKNVTFTDGWIEGEER